MSVLRATGSWGHFRLACWLGLLAAGMGVGAACGRAPLGENQIAPATCGDLLCDSHSENPVVCPQDCFCGDSVCSETETRQPCPTDCASGCGDGDCTDGETAANCPADC